MLKFCPQCGAKVLSENAKFCMECGQSFANLESANTEPIPADNSSGNDFFDEAANTDNSDNGDNFFDEAVNTSNSDNGSDFFDSLDEAASKEDEAVNIQIAEAEKYFLRGEFRKVENLLENFIGKDYGRANYMLSIIYEYGGNGITADKENAFELLGDLKDDLTSMHFVNFYLTENHPNLQEINQWVADNLAQLESSNDVFMKFEVGYYYGNRLEQMNKYINYLGVSEQLGFWLASFYLGLVYEKGLIGVNQNFNKACQHYVRAAKKGIAAPARAAGMCYYTGTGVKQDFRLAKKYLLIGANQNDEESMQFLGDLYLGEENYNEAVHWMEKCVSMYGNETAAVELGMTLMNIDDDARIRTDWQRAYKLFEFVLSQNPQNALALYFMGIMYFVGKVVDKNLETAKHYLQLAYQYGDGNTKRNAQELLNRINTDQQNEGCFITTAVCGNFGKPDDCYELTMFRNFRDNWLINQSDGKSLINEYYEVAPKIVAKINQLANPSEIYRSIWKNYLKPCLMFIESGNFLRCKSKYIDMVNNLRIKYLN